MSNQSLAPFFSMSGAFLRWNPHVVAVFEPPHEARAGAREIRGTTRAQNMIVGGFNPLKNVSQLG